MSIEVRRWLILSSSINVVIAISINSMIITVMIILRSCYIVLTVTVLNIYGDSIPVVIPPTSPKIAVNSRLNLLYRLQDAIGPSQLPSWMNASASLVTR